MTACAAFNLAVTSSTTATFSGRGSTELKSFISTSSRFDSGCSQSSEHPRSERREASYDSEHPPRLALAHYPLATASVAGRTSGLRRATVVCGDPCRRYRSLLPFAPDPRESDRDMAVMIRD